MAAAAAIVPVGTGMNDQSAVAIMYLAFDLSIG
jgi:hypothetical protein